MTVREPWLAARVEERQWPLTDGSVMGLHPREALSLKVVEGPHGWWAVAYTGDGSKPGSVESGAGSFHTPEEAFAYLLEHTADTRAASSQEQAT